MLLKKNPRIVWRIAMLCLLAFFAMNVVARYAPPVQQDFLDGVRGALLGATIGLMIVVGVIKRRGDAARR
ncbi:MAG TPA: hypothetical protein VGP25_16270 [Gemmatimonadaceae bacterium]|jgi:hypothetical protein|nr:hypothetical protein [Gemmatimonadaceae bacterium]